MECVAASICFRVALEVNSFAALVFAGPDWKHLIVTVLLVVAPSCTFFIFIATDIGRQVGLQAVRAARLFSRESDSLPSLLS